MFSMTLSERKWVNKSVMTFGNIKRIPDFWPHLRLQCYGNVKTSVELTPTTTKTYDVHINM